MRWGCDRCRNKDAYVEKATFKKKSFAAGAKNEPQREQQSTEGCRSYDASLTFFGKNCEISGEELLNVAKICAKWLKYTKKVCGKRHADLARKLLLKRASPFIGEPRLRGKAAAPSG